jgi:dienelactone hydrolase
MPGERWQRVDELFNSVRDMPPDSRAAFLRNACDGDRDLQDEVSALIAAWENSDGFLADSALDVFARQVSIEGWTVRSGDRVDSYVIDRRIGAGGMGEVWRARDDRLDRFVALKLLLPRDGDGHARVRILADEARTAGSLNHPNILTVHDVGTHRGMPYLVTELLEGASLRARLARGPMALDDALAVALQIARGLRAAHARGIVHRDLKPENIFLTIDGIVKIVDFGLATLQRPDDSGSASEPIAGGTRGYMAPEQRRLGSVGAAADVYALGVILHEMLAGSRPARQEDAQVPRRGDRRISQRAARLIHRCTAESAQTRPSAADIVTELESIAAARERRIRTLARRPAVMVTAAAVLIVAGALAWRWSRTSAREEWARRIAAPQIEQLTAQGDFTAAYLLARRALAALPDDPHLQQLWLDTTVPVSVDTDPDGADVSIASYRNPGEWIWLGRSPLKDARMPRTVVRTRITKHGFADVEGSMQPPGARYELEPVAVVPAGMVRIVGDQDPLRPGLIGSLGDFWISRFEVTNREFTRFVEAGGYTRREYWREPLVDQGRLLAWTAAIARFRDRTGQFGPANWRGGTYPEGQADYPVVGVSWYEAAAYATFAGKSLPTIHHWKAAASPGRFADVLVASNFSGKGPAAVGAYRGVGPFGTYDMAGNVKEWCSTAAADGRHFVLGGAWNEPRYMFDDFDAREPFYRGENIGFRVAQYDAPLPHAETAAVHLETLGGDLRTHAPVPDEIFDVYRREYAYDPRPLNASIEATIHRPLWDRDTVAFDAAYGAGERVRAYLFLPKNMTPPFQTVVIFPSSDSKRLASSGDMSLAAVDLAMSTGRAVLYPVYKGTYERAVPDVEGPAAARDLRIAWSRDLGRSIDYLSTRREIDSTRIAFYGTSLGGDAGIVLVPLEPRFKAAILQGSGLNRAAAPDIDPINFAPRLHVPVLMLNGRYDFERPLETSQTPLFQLIGSVEKKHAVFESGHSLATGDVASAVREWLDRYLGPPRR